MKSILDTNVLLRFLVGDNLAQKNQAAVWFKEAEQGMRDIAVHPLVVAESCFVLESVYGKPRDEIAYALEVFLTQRWLGVVERDALALTWSGYRSGLHFVDSFLIALAQLQSAELLTFDKRVLTFYSRG